MTTCDHCDLQVTMCPDHVMPHRRFGQCLPFCVASMPGVGRCAVASRDIAPGEVVLEDEAVMVAPGGGQRLCLECGSPCLEAKCGQCRLPLCCQGPRHQAECQHRLQFSSNTSRHLGVAVVRLLEYLDHLDSNLSWQRDEVNKLMSHLDSRRCDNDFKDMENVVKQILPALKDRYSEEDLLNYAGEKNLQT